MYSPGTKQYNTGDLYKYDSQMVVCEPIPLASPENTSYIFLGPHPRLSESETQRVRPNDVI